MAARGKREIGFIGKYMHCQSFYERYMGYRGAMCMMELPCREAYCIVGNRAGAKRQKAGENQEYLMECKPDLPGIDWGRNREVLNNLSGQA